MMRDLHPTVPQGFTDLCSTGRKQGGRLLDWTLPRTHERRRGCAGELRLARRRSLLEFGAISRAQTAPHPRVPSEVPGVHTNEGTALRGTRGIEGPTRRRHLLRLRNCRV